MTPKRKAEIRLEIMQPRDGPFQTSLPRPTLTQNEFSNKSGQDVWGVTTVPWHVLFCQSPFIRQGCASSPLPWCQSLHHSLPSLIFRKLCCSCGVAQFFFLMSLRFSVSISCGRSGMMQRLRCFCRCPLCFFLWHDLLAGHWCCNRWGQPILPLKETFNKFSTTPNVNCNFQLAVSGYFDNPWSHHVWKLIRPPIELWWGGWFKLKAL